MKRNYLLALLSVGVFSCGSGTKSENIQIAEAEDEGWIYLFDGTSTEGWRAYNGEELPPQWTIDEEGALTFDTEKRLEEDWQGGKDIIYAAEEFDNFELYMEWKLPAGGNSGIFYHLKENEPGGPPAIAPEYQLLDDLGWEEINNATLAEWQKTGADYAMHAADTTQKIVKPAGEWNTSKIIFTPEKVEHWLNGKKIVEFVPWSDDWHERKAAGKWKDFPKYGSFKTGYIGLQDHDSPLWFKNIKIRKL
ncbi:glycosyl hydrolase [Roseivirga spongicola]|uniref:Glycosyl hydrolase n=1 Tax=Roseivirga spongicola TaxID=333140 RepID=A0A150X5E4_9BACT|nr:DUF1080 domain-containing protein [Roseivirga spongicola]KYG73872.1 glycosyl hydrolase [Roseivirga spongicola]